MNHASTQALIKLLVDMNTTASTGIDPYGKINRQIQARLDSAKPQFTPDELKWLETLPKKERKRAIQELKAKHRSSNE